MPIDDRTTNRSYQLPNAGNQLVEDVARLRAALQAIDADIFARYTKTEVDTLISNLIQGAPGALDTLNELAAAMGDDPNFATTVTNQLALKANSADVYTKAQADARYVQGQVQTEMVFIATANQSVFTLTTPVINKPSALVSVDGVVQPTAEYSLNQTGTQLTLSEGVPAGTIVRVLVLGVASEGAPADDTVTEPKLRTGAVSTRALAEGIEPVVASLNGGQLAGTRNRIINGDMRIDQRNTVATTNATYSADRWRLSLSTSGAVSVSQSTAKPTVATSGTALGNSLLVDVTTADTSIAAGDYFSIEQPIEGFNVSDLGFGEAGASSVTVSFWIRCTTTGTYCVSIANSVSTRSYVSTYTVTTANTWERKVITIPGDTSGTWLTNNEVGLRLRFAFAAGSTFQTTADSWQTGNFLATSAQANLLSSAANEAYITGVQLEPGTVATPFERRSHGLELALCQRYYEVLGPVAVMFPWSNTTQIIRGQGQFAVTKRVAPTVTMGTKLNGVGTLSASSIDQYGCMFTGSGNASDVVTYTGNTASAEL